MIEKLKFLPPFLLSALRQLDFSRLFEVRLRANRPVKVCYNSGFFYLSASGISNKKSEALTVSPAAISEIVLRAAEFSIYAVSGQISDGYLSLGGGIRLGVAGEVVYEGEKVKTQKSFSSLVLRIPHEVRGAANLAFGAIKSVKNRNLLLVSPPGAGKTTILRDLARQVSDAGFNTLVVDERGELAACHGGAPTLDIGENSDVISGGLKQYAFLFGVRSLRPDYIITDELAGAEDAAAVQKAASSGVNVIASIHAADLEDLRRKPDFMPLLSSGIFGLYIFLSLKKGAGTYEEVLDQDFRPLNLGFYEH